MSLLTISIPIYNRAKYLERMLERFMLEKSLFEDTIHLFISDNCSQDDLESICQKYQNSGLRLEYNRNERNLGMDGNFEICISKGLESDYLWVLGSDDIPTEGIFDIILPILCRGINTLHLSMTEGEIEEIVYDNVVEYLKDINVMITFLSANIISSREIGHVDMKKYQNSYFTQMPVYLITMFTGVKNVMLKCRYLQKDSDSQNNGGYPFFKVFMDNYFSIWEEFVKKGFLTRSDYEYIKRVTFERFHWDYVRRTLLGQPSQALDMSGCKKTVLRHFGTKPYLYSHLFQLLKEQTKWKIKKLIGYHS